MIPSTNRLLASAILLGSLASALWADQPPEGFVSLFDGKSLKTSFTIVSREKEKPGNSWIVKDGRIVNTGGAHSYLTTNRPFRNYVLCYCWRYPRPKGLANDAKFAGNSGVLLHIQGEHKVWPKCIEVQGMYRDQGNIFGLGATFKGVLNKEARDKARRPVGQWNVTEITVQNGQITVKLNGIEVCTGKGELFEGPIGWKAEDTVIEFKNLWIKEKK